MTPAEQATGLRLVRRCDAYDILEQTFEKAVRRGDVTYDGHIDNVRAELLMRREEAANNLRLFKRMHGIPE